jgi:hypothetical protein
MRVLGQLEDLAAQLPEHVTISGMLAYGALVIDVPPGLMTQLALLDMRRNDVGEGDH